MSVYICSKSSVASSVRMSLRSKAYFALLWQSRGSALVNSGPSRRLKHHLKQLSSSRPAIGAFFCFDGAFVDNNSCGVYNVAYYKYSIYSSVAS